MTELYYTNPIDEEIAKRIKKIKKKMSPPAWRNHMWLLNQPLPSIEETVNKIMSVKNPQYRTIFAVIYLTASRVSEIMELRDRETNQMVEESIPLKFFWLEDANGHVIKQGDRLEPKWVVIQTRVLKLRAGYKKRFPMKRWKKAYIDVNDPRIQPLLVVINDHINSLYDQRPDAPMFKNYSSHTISNISSRYLKWNPHYLRHLRASHLVKYYNHNDTDLRAALGWASTTMSARYTHSDEESLKRKMEVF